MENYLLVMCEILLIVVMPLLVLYLKGNWPLRKIIPSLVIIPVFWYFSYTILHELSHAAGLYLVGGNAIDHRLIPRFWLGQFSGAWVTPSGIPQNWQQLTFHSFPYLLDIVCLVVAIFVFKRGFSRNPFFLVLLSCFCAFDRYLTLWVRLLVCLLAGEVIYTICNRLSDPLQYGHLSRSQSVSLSILFCQP